MADLLDKPIIVKRASDLLSMWMGRTEENIAEMFREAQEDGALLLLDEADSFLQDRRGAHRSWEITQVNELLTQMECFRGLFLCATNFMDSLDAAVLRRFSFKIRFDYLTRAQREKCFLRTLRDVGCSIEKLPAGVSTALARLANLTPGDFTVVRERHRMQSLVPFPKLFLDELTKESRLKPGGPRSPIGFAPGTPDKG